MPSIDHSSSLSTRFTTPAGSYIYNAFENTIVPDDGRVEVSSRQVWAEAIEHPNTRLIEAFLDGHLSHICLQVTRSCNLRCKYCPYTLAEDRRSHLPEKMSRQIAEKALRFSVDHSWSRDSLSVSFYGGEPLLNLDLIRHAVQFLQEYVPSKTVNFSLTTNGTLLNEETIDFLSANSFNVLISLDGPKHIHDRNRVFLNNRGTFDVVIKNLRIMKEKSPEYVKKHVAISGVMDNSISCHESYQFLCSDPIVDGLQRIYLKPETPHSNERKKKRLVGTQNSSFFEYEKFKFLYGVLKGIPYDNQIIAQMVEGEVQELKYKLRPSSDTTKFLFHPGGPPPVST